MAVMWSLIIGLFLLVLPLAPSSSSYMNFDLGGNVYPAGHYNVTMLIGDPPMPYYLDIDTGSNLTWLECNLPCKSCNKVPHPLYTPKNPQNLRVLCGQNPCNVLRQDVGDGNPDCTRKDSHVCHYRIQYVDGSSDGVLANDYFTLHGRRTEKKPFVFGCGYNQQPKKSSPVSVDGILGLGMGRLGFVAHLRMHRLITKNIIGHCMNRTGGYLLVGDFKLPSHGVTWVHMKNFGYHYSPGRATLLFNGQQTSAKELVVIFDSGATYTYMPAQTYHGLISKVKSSLNGSLTEVHDPALVSVCWKGREPFKSVDDVKKEFKPLALHFANNIVMDIPPENYLVVTNLGNVCLGILDGSVVPGLDALNVLLIGDVTMQDLFVIYDNESRRLGWVHGLCPQFAST